MQSSPAFDFKTFDITSRASYRHWTPVTIRYCDADMSGHVNNCAYATYFEAARVALIDLLFERDRREKPTFNSVVARLLIEYKRELHYPGTVEVGARLIKFGAKSFTTGYGCFIGETCVATCESVNVCFDTATRASIVMPDVSRQRLQTEIEVAGT